MAKRKQESYRKLIITCVCTFIALLFPYHLRAKTIEYKDNGKELANKDERADSMLVCQLRHKGISFSHNNSVTLLCTGQEKFDDLFKAIDQARSSIHLEYFNFRNDSSNDELISH